MRWEWSARQRRSGQQGREREVVRGFGLGSAAQRAAPVGCRGGRTSSPYVSGFWREAVKQSKDDGDHGIGTRTKDARTSRDWNLEGR